MLSIGMNYYCCFELIEDRQSRSATWEEGARSISFAPLKFFEL